jgi:hypothetical protein
MMLEWDCSCVFATREMLGRECYCVKVAVTDKQVFLCEHSSPKMILHKPVTPKSCKYRDYLSYNTPYLILLGQMVLT